MSEEAEPLPCLRIEPEPKDAELIAILFAIQPNAQETPIEPPRSKWATTARVEQLRSPLDARRPGWKR